MLTPNRTRLMKTAREKLEDIPGTYVFNSGRCREGLHLNMFFTSLLKAENRKSFQADEKKYLDQYRLTAEQRRCVLERDWIGMLKVNLLPITTDNAITNHCRGPALL